LLWRPSRNLTRVSRHIKRSARRHSEKCLTPLHSSTRTHTQLSSTTTSSQRIIPIEMSRPSSRSPITHKRREANFTPEPESSSSSKRPRLDDSKALVDGDTKTCDDVLHIAELLERVLSFLPPKQIFAIQRVSCYWKEVITASPDIQEAMFLRARPADRPLELWEEIDLRTGYLKSKSRMGSFGDTTIISS
jgi:hypothetical protein